MCNFGECNKEDCCFCYDYKILINFAKAIQLVSLNSQATVPFIPWRQTLPEIRTLLRKCGNYVRQFYTPKNPAGEKTNKQTKQKQGPKAFLIPFSVHK